MAGAVPVTMPVTPHVTMVMAVLAAEARAADVLTTSSSATTAMPAATAAPHGIWSRARWCARGKVPGLILLLVDRSIC
jgi:hypothetical protein